jgi:DNA-binding IclR family transcriptional regulator
LNNTLKNGFMILEYLAADAEECSVKELAGHFGLPNSHICRLLKTLAETGYVEQIPGRRTYRISLKILHLSNARLRKLKLRAIARPHLRQLVRALKRPAYLSANHGGRSLIIGTEYPDRFAGDAGLALGELHLINRSACGKICAAYAPVEVLETLIEACDWSRATAHSITSPEAFREELEQIRRQGFARMAAEGAPGLGAVGAPIFNAAGELVGAVGVVMPDDEKDWTPERWETFTARTRACAESISFALGFRRD